MNNLLVVGLKSNIITPKKSVMDELKIVLKISPLQEKDILVITSKVVAITQGKMKKIASKQEFEELVKDEADEVIGGNEVILTKKNNIYIPWAGIDRSNIPDGYALPWPESPFEEAYSFLKQLKKTYRIKDLGIIISDSVCFPLRRGVGAVAIGYAGFKGVNDLRGEKDLYGKKMKVSQQNMADMVAVSAHIVMGETDESTPFAIVRGAKVEFIDFKTDPKEPVIDSNQCIFSPMLKNY